MDVFKMVKELYQDDVVLKDREDLEKKLQLVMDDGPQKLQILADFDATLTKGTVDGKPAAHSMDILTMTKGLSDAYLRSYAELVSKYLPEYGRAPSDDEKQQLLYEWWDAHQVVLKGEKITADDIYRSTDAAKTPLRDGTDEMFSILDKYGVPLTVISAGVGEVVQRSLARFKPNIMSNFINFDNEQGIVGFIKPLISVFDKHLVSLPEHYDRPNVIVLGDSTGDCTMAEAVPNSKTIIKIGFLNSNNEEQLKIYKDCFDIVLLNDQSMNVIIAVLKLVLDPSAVTSQ